MSLTDDLADLMTQTVVWEERLGVDAHGEPLYAGPVTCLCRIAGRQRYFYDRTGAMRVSSVQIHMREPHGVQVLDRITLPAPFQPAQPSLLAVRQSPDDTGAIIETVYTQ